MASLEQDDFSEPGDFAWQLVYTIADTLPLDKRKELYLKGEVEFVLAGTETGK